jgi:hypothetical protein
MEPQLIAGRRRPLRTKAAAEYLGLSKSTMDKLRLSGGGPLYYKLRRIVVYDPDDLDRWRGDHRRTSTSDRRSACNVNA